MRHTAILLALATAAPGAALAQESAETPTWWVSGQYTAEVIGPVSGGLARRGVFLDDLSIEAGVDLERLVSWPGASLNLHLLNNSGGEPNLYAGTLEGVSNIEVSRQRGKLFELWLDQAFANDSGSLVVGFYDLNRDFYVTDASGLLTAPPFGIGSEVAATGPNGPSIFPSTALGGRVRVAPQDAGWYAQAAAFDATASVLGDPDGISADFAHGALLIAEAGLTRSGKTALGAWTYTRKQDDIREVDLNGDPLQAEAYGIYFLAERRLSDRRGALDGFVRAGVSDGDTTDFTGGLQSGVLWSGLFPSRPDAQASLGVRYAALSDKARENLRDAGIRPAASEWGFELTYADPIAPWLTLQPSSQLVFNAGGDRDADTALILGFPMIVALDAEG